MLEVLQVGASSGSRYLLTDPFGNQFLDNSVYRTWYGDSSVDISTTSCDNFKDNSANNLAH